MIQLIIIDEVFGKIQVFLVGSEIVIRFGAGVKGDRDEGNTFKRLRYIVKLQADPEDMPNGGTDPIK
ncbi:MAG: hypothetical protein II969_02925 [Anaerolineaceae bacterium]|nr:hypothetical protein [Anaerolineaceae bacterium]